MDREKIKAMLKKKLPRDHRLLLIMLYIEEMSEAEAAMVLEISPSRVAEMHAEMRHTVRLNMQPKIVLADVELDGVL